MNLFFLYVSGGDSGAEYSEAQTQNHYALNIVEEGYHSLIAALQSSGTVQKSYCVIESSKSPGTLTTSAGVQVLVVPRIELIRPLMQPDDILFVRQGFRSWFEFIKQEHEQGRFTMLYGANGGRERWRVWDVILDDLEARDFIDELGRLHLNFRKPINTDLFYFKPGGQIEYDVMIGASHIHDKKAQWKTARALARYEQTTGRRLRAVMPGSERRGAKTGELYTMIDRGTVSIDTPGMLSRRELGDLMRRTHLFVNPGFGQGDRSVIEALHCGCRCIIGQPNRHNPAVCEKFDTVCAVDEEAICKAFHDKLGKETDERRRARAAKAYRVFSLREYTVPRFRKLFKMIQEEGKQKTVEQWVNF